MIPLRHFQGLVFLDQRNVSFEFQLQPFHFVKMEAGGKLWAEYVCVRVCDRLSESQRGRERVRSSLFGLAGLLLSFLQQCFM